MAPKGEKVEQEENRMAPRGSCTLLPPISLSLILGLAAHSCGPVLMGDKNKGMVRGLVLYTLFEQ